MSLLEIKNLGVEFGFGAKALRALDGVSLTLEAGEKLCLAGESGSGKSVTALSIPGLVPAPPARYFAGEILLEGRDTLKLTPTELQGIRGRMVGCVFQEPGASLNPVMRVGAQLREALGGRARGAQADAEAARLLGRVGIPGPEARLRSYPFELSGGMQQRVMLAIAIAARPRLLIADEPTTALDVTTQAQILELLEDLRRELGMAILLITHNLALASGFADRVAVMYAGQVVETGPARELLRHPLHPYTRALVESVPILGAKQARLKAIPGTAPTLGAFPSGCRFHPRCPIAVPECASTAPALSERNPGRWVRCPFASG